MTDATRIDAVVAATVKAFGGVSTLVSNVGRGGRHEDPEATSDEDFIASYKLNTISAYLTSMARLPLLLKAENATITNSGSMFSVAPANDILAYGTARAALNQMMISVAHFLNWKVRANSVLTGTVMTAGYGDAGIDPGMPQRLSHPDTPPCPPRHACTLVSTVDGRHYPTLSAQGRAVSPDAYVWSDPARALSVSLSPGRQNFTLNEGFLIPQFGSQWNAGQRPGNYMVPRTTHDFAAIGRP